MYGEEEINREGYLIGDNKNTFLKEKYWLVRWGGGDVYVPLISSRDYKTCPYLGSQTNENFTKTLTLQFLNQV